VSLPPLYLITDAEQYGEDPVVGKASRAAIGGLSMVIVREPGWCTERVESFAVRLREVLPKSMRILIGCRSGDEGRARRQIVTRHDLNGVHVGGGDVDLVRQSRDDVGDARLVGYSAHSTLEAIAAFERGADYVSLSPIFAPLSKVSSLTPIGIEGLRAACDEIGGPVYALGGVREDRVNELRRSGASGVAVIGALLNAEDPASSARSLAAPWSSSASRR
jgi:thiamine-phosphate pyrophosphorylase